MNFKRYAILIGLLIIGLTACQPNTPTNAPPAATPMLEPSPRPFPLPPAQTPTVLVPTATSTKVIQATYTSKPPTDTPTPLPTAADTPVVENTPTTAPVAVSGQVNWEDSDGEPTIVQGQDEGFFIWTDGDQIYIRGISKGATYIFSGQATGTGTIVNIDALAPGMTLDVQENVNQVAFEWVSSGGPDGLNFSFNGDTLQLDLNIASTETIEPNLVFVGPDKTQASMSMELVR